MPRPLIEVSSLSKSFGTQLVLDQVSFAIPQEKKIALIGRNGAGKSTLLKILLGEIEPDTGSFELFDWTRVGAVHQNEVLPETGTSLSYLENVSNKPAWEIQRMASQFGLTHEDLAKPPGLLSGGYQMRLKLTALFLGEPNLLYLDEPVNYLDLQTLLLLETVLADYKGSFLLVAHDRTFLENTCDTVFEIERGKLTTFNGKVSAFLDWKAQQLVYVRRTNKKLMREIAHHKEFVDRFRAKKNLASRAQNKIKHMARLRTKIAHINADLLTTRISISAKPTTSGSALRVEHLAIGYDNKPLASNISFDIQRGEKVVIVGENGRGKTTLLKTLVGHIPALSGTIKWWKHADIGYYDQLTSKSLNPTDTVLNHLTTCAPASATSEKILMMAGNFLFSGDDLDKRVDVLSGGERARLALAGVLLQTHTVLVLDEPTNHMDVETSEGLAVALKEYTGTVLFVSHARTFVSELANRILDVHDGCVREYLGDYDDYVETLSERMAFESQDTSSDAPVAKQHNGPSKKEIYLEQKRRSRIIATLEAQVEKTEAEKSELLRFFFENPTDYAPTKAERLHELSETLSQLEQAWLKEQEQIEQLRNI